MVFHAKIQKPTLESFDLSSLPLYKYLKVFYINSCQKHILTQLSSQLFTSSNSIQLSNLTVYRPVCRLFIFLSFKCFCCGVLTALRYTYVIMYLYGLSIPIFVLNWQSVKVFTFSSYMNVIIARIINAKDDGVGLKVRQTEKLE